MKKIIFFTYIILLSGCSSFILLKSPSANLGQQWKKDGQYSYKIINKCSSLAKKKLNQEEILFFKLENINTEQYKHISSKYQKELYNCMYDNGYRFKPDIGYCYYWHDSYECLHKENYSN